jgi:hypothetical protein
MYCTYIRKRWLYYHKFIIVQLVVILRFLGVGWGWEWEWEGVKVLAVRRLPSVYKQTSVCSFSLGNNCVVVSLHVYHQTHSRSYMLTQLNILHLMHSFPLAGRVLLFVRLVSH